MSRLKICGISDAGCLREKNEDTFLVGSIIERKEMQLIVPCEGYHIEHYGLFCAVADGLGGHQCGDVASHLVLESLAKESFAFKDYSSPRELEVKLEEHIKHYHDFILKQGEEKPEFYGMGTTLTGVYLHQSFNLLFHVGDSRLYRYRGDFLAQLTKDHTIESMTHQVSGELPDKPKSGMITNCIGGGASAGCNPDTGEVQFKTGDILLLCSDGLSDMVAMETIENIIARSEELTSAASDLAAAAKEAGGHDNITAVLIEKY